MKRLKHGFFLIPFLLLLFGFNSNNSKPKVLVGNKVSDFRLRNTNGKMLSLKDYPKAKGFIIVFTCNHCPFANLYTSRLNAMNTKFSSMNVPLLAINSMDTLMYDDETFADMQKKAVGQHFNFPYLQDATQSVGKNFQADHTPQAFIIWKEKADWLIKYAGAIDDNGADTSQVQHPFLLIALTQLLQGQTVKEPQQSSLGCAIYYRK